MNKDKLMKIVQAVNDSKSEPHDIRQPDYHHVACSTGAQRYQKGEVHAVNNKATEEYWDIICTTEEFNQCVKEMSAGYGKKESNMNNEHPHHDLIAEWFSDMSKEIQVDNGLRVTEDFRWVGRSIDSVIADYSGTYEFRFKPREFVKGHWYPCLDGDSGIQVLMFTGSGFSATSRFHHEDSPNCFHSIGESLGEINFK